MQNEDSHLSKLAMEGGENTYKKLKLKASKIGEEMIESARH